MNNEMTQEEKQNRIIALNAGAVACAGRDVKPDKVIEYVKAFESYLNSSDERNR